MRGYTACICDEYVYVMVVYWNVVGVVVVGIIEAELFD